MRMKDLEYSWKASYIFHIIIETMNFSSFVFFVSSFFFLFLTSLALYYSHFLFLSPPQLLHKMVKLIFNSWIFLKLS